MKLYQFFNDFFSISRPDSEERKPLITAADPDEARLKGIHDNIGCVRCGSCCVCYHIEFPDGSVSKSGHVCPYLDYDLDTKTAKCTIYYNGAIRPQECRDYPYCAIGNVTDLDMWLYLHRTAKKMPQIMEKHKRKLERRLEKQRIKAERKKNSKKRFIFW